MFDLVMVSRVGDEGGKVLEDLLTSTSGLLPPPTDIVIDGLTFKHLALPVPGGLYYGFVVALLVAILLPSPARAREMAKRTVSAEQMRGIGMACFMYATEHNDRFPPDLQTLVDQGLLAPEALMSPYYMPGRECYVYIPGLTQSRPDLILLHEHPDLHIYTRVRSLAGSSLTATSR